MGSAVVVGIFEMRGGDIAPNVRALGWLGVLRDATRALAC